MRLRLPRALLAVVSGLLPAVGGAAPEARSDREKASLELVSSRTAAPAGGSIDLAAVVTIEPGWHIQAHRPTFEYLIPTVLELELPPDFAAGPVLYPEPVPYPVAFADQPLAVYKGRVVLPFDLRIPDDAPSPATLRARLRYQACDDRSCLPPVETQANLELPIGTNGIPQHEEIFSPAGNGSSLLETKGSAPARSRLPAATGMLPMLGLALLGGLILNAMPCVLPVLSLKAVGLVRSAAEGSARVRTRSLATATGILLSFWILALAAVLARTAGATVGWGIQFQEPRFVAFLAVVVLLFTLNLWGLFEIVAPGVLMTAAERPSRAGGLAGDLAAGLFATLMATPCSAPFLGTALSFALAQTPGTIFGIFTAIGVGLALPYLLLAAWPGFLRWIPRPGAWMETLKGALGFLLAGALVWLFYVLQSQVSPENLAFFQLALLALALLLWVTNRNGSRQVRVSGWVAATLLAVAAVALAGGEPAARASLPAEGAASNIAWIPFDRSEAERLASEEGRLVFVDITADWCVTCKVNERVVLSHPEVVAAFDRFGVVAMKGDWTNRNEEIARFLAEHGRYGIPFYLLYRPGREPHLFGELITRQGVLGVLETSLGGR